MFCGLTNWNRSCNSKILEKVIEYLTKHHEFDKTGTSQEDKDAWDKKYVEVEDEDLFFVISRFFGTIVENVPSPLTIR